MFKQQLFLSTLAATTLFLAACNEWSKKPEQATEKQVAAYHEQVVSLLKASDEVNPPKPDIYPVAAVYNRENIIPPMCYTRTEGKHNPCYVCHQNAIPERENVMNDGGLQVAYSFSDLGLINRWQNLFADKSARVAKITNDEIINWVNQDNYSELAGRLEAVDFKGWIPDLKNLHLGAAAFDNQGFAKDGSQWVAFNYKPFPSTFWPTNGSTDDVMIKLPEAYRQNQVGEEVQDIYKANLAILEAKIKGVKTISTWPIDENKIGKDLNQDKQLSVINNITALDDWVGAAQGYFIDTYLYPQGTEFLHTVRYLGFNERGEVGVSKRMKEVRYMKKWKAYPKQVMARYYEEEAFDKEAGHLPGYTHLGDYGFDNDSGWSVQGFMENAQGRLRVASFEENMFCMGCHGSVGSTIDKTFSFARKMDGKKGWGYINLKGMPDAPNMGETEGEIATYFQRVGGGDEFRGNDEMLAKWFNQDGTVNKQALKGKDVYALIVPSKERALALNKAYKVLVEDQSFIYGRDANVLPSHNVYQAVDNETSPTLAPEFVHDWDIRLHWLESARK